jgi:Cullin family
VTVLTTGVCVCVCVCVCARARGRTCTCARVRFGGIGGCADAPPLSHLHQDAPFSLAHILLLWIPSTAQVTTTTTTTTASLPSYTTLFPPAPPPTFTINSKGFWPTYKSLDLALPAEMVEGIAAFKEFYEADAKHRKLTWVYTQVCLGGLGAAVNYDSSGPFLDCCCG